MEQCLREGLPFPDKIANAPSLLQGLELYYIAFMELSDSRMVGMGLGRIPWKTVHDYCEAHHFPPDQREEMHHHVREMDGAYIEFSSRKK